MHCGRNGRDLREMVRITWVVADLASVPRLMQYVIFNIIACNTDGPEMSKEIPNGAASGCRTQRFVTTTKISDYAELSLTQCPSVSGPSRLNAVR